jgi:hypothetical protein
MGTIVDLHSHLWAEDWLPAAWWEMYADVIVRELEKRGRDVDHETVTETFLPTFWDPTGETLLGEMDRAGIDRQVVFAVDFGLALGEAPVPIEEVNRHIADFAASDDRVTAFVAIDPRREGAPEFVERAIEDWGMQGIKLHPATGFYPTDEAAYALYEIAREHDVPVLTHTGPIGQALRSKYTHPNRLDDVLCDFPDLDLVAAHMGLGWWRDLLAVAEMKGNTGLHVDVCSWQGHYERRPEEFVSALRQFIDVLGVDRVHFATDYPVFVRAAPVDEWLAEIRGLVDRTEPPTFTEAEIESVLGTGAEALFD